MEWPNTLEAYNLRLSEDGRALSGFSASVGNSCGYSASSSANATDRTQKNAQYYDGFFGNKKVSLKVFVKADLDQQGLEEVKQEVIVHSQLQHDYITNIHHIFEDERKIVMVLERASGVALQMPSQREEQVRTEFFNLLQALAYIHSLRFLHKNLSLESLFYVDGVLKIGNFNRACRFQDPQDVESPVRKLNGCPQEDLMALGRAAYMRLTGLCLPAEGPLAPSLSSRCAQWIETTRWTTCEESLRHPFFLPASVPRIISDRKSNSPCSREFSAKKHQFLTQNHAFASSRDVSTTAEGLSTIVSSFASRHTGPGTPSRMTYASVPLREESCASTPNARKRTNVHGRLGPTLTDAVIPEEEGQRSVDASTSPILGMSQAGCESSTALREAADLFTPTFHDTRLRHLEYTRGHADPSMASQGWSPRIPSSRGRTPLGPSVRREDRATPSGWRPSSIGAVPRPSVHRTPRTPFSATRASSSDGSARNMRNSWHPTSGVTSGWRGGSLGMQFDRALSASAPLEDMDGIIGFVGSDFCDEESAPSLSVPLHSPSQSTHHVSLRDYLPSVASSLDGSRVHYSPMLSRSSPVWPPAAGRSTRDANDWRLHNGPATPSSASSALPRTAPRPATANHHHADMKATPQISPPLSALQHHPVSKQYWSSLAHPWSDSSVTHSENTMWLGATSSSACFSPRNNATAQFGQPGTVESSLFASDSMELCLGSPTMRSTSDALSLWGSRMPAANSTSGSHRPVEQELFSAEMIDEPVADVAPCNVRRSHERKNDIGVSAIADEERNIEEVACEVDRMKSQDGATGCSGNEERQGDSRTCATSSSADKWNATVESACSSVPEFHCVVRPPPTPQSPWRAVHRPSKRSFGIVDARRVQPISIHANGHLIELSETKQLRLSFPDTSTGQPSSSSTMVIEPGGVLCFVNGRKYAYQALPDVWAERYEYAREVVNTLRANTPLVICLWDDITGKLMDFPYPQGDFHATFHSSAVTKALIRQGTIHLTAKSLTEMSIPLDMSEISFANVGWEFGNISAVLERLKKCYRRCLQAEHEMRVKLRTGLGALRVTAPMSLSDFTQLTKSAWPVSIDERTSLPEK